MRLVFATVLIAIALGLTSQSRPSFAQPNDCVAQLASCTTICHQQKKEQERPQCANACIASYQRCDRRQLLPGTVAPFSGQTMQGAPQ